jgi:MFS family permease
VFAILAVSYVFVSMRAPGLAVRHGRSVITAAGLTLVAAHLLLIGAVALFGTGGTVFVLAPGLIAGGIGMGLGIGPLSANLLATLRPEQAGSAAGALATAQFVGNALGVAIVGVAFFGSLHRGYGPALEAGLAVLAGALALVAVLSRALPASEAER